MAFSLLTDDDAGGGGGLLFESFKHFFSSPWLLFGDPKFLDNDCRTLIADLILEEPNGELIADRCSSFSFSVQSIILESSPSREMLRAAFENVEELLSLALQFVTGHSHSSPVVCSRRHWLQKT